jgi:signal peptidase I
MPALGSIAIVAAGIFFWVTSELYTVRGPSMLPSYSPGDRVWISSIAETPERFDAVVVEREDRHYLKRVIALPGESLRFVQGDLEIDGRRLRRSGTDPWRLRGTWEGLPDAKPWEVKGGGLLYSDPIYALGYLNPTTITSTGIPQEDLRVTIDLTVDPTREFQVILRRSDAPWAVKFGKDGYPVSEGRHTIVCWVRDGAYGVEIDGQSVDSGRYEKRDTATGPIWRNPIVLPGIARMTVHSIRLEEDTYYFISADTGTVLSIPSGSVYVVGDNTFESTDSRTWGSVPLTALDGVVIGVFEGE